jgi:hypothetical protein
MQKRDLFGRYLPLNPEYQSKKRRTLRAKRLRRRLLQKINEAKLHTETGINRSKNCTRDKPLTALPSQEEAKLPPFHSLPNKGNNESDSQDSNNLEPLNLYSKDQIHFEFVHIDELKTDDDSEWRLITEWLIEETAKLKFIKGKSSTTFPGIPPCNQYNLPPLESDIKNYSNQYPSCITNFPDDKELDWEVEQILKNPLPPFETETRIRICEPYRPQFSTCLNPIQAPLQKPNQPHLNYN